MSFRASLCLIFICTLSGCVNLTKIGDDASEYPSSMPAKIQPSQFLSGARIYFLTLEEDAEYQALDKYYQDEQRKLRKFFLSHIEPKIIALGGTISSSREQADVILAPSLTSENVYTGATQINFVASLFTLGVLPIHFTDKVMLSIKLSTPNGSLFEEYSYREEYSEWFGGWLTLLTRFGGNAKAAAVDQVTNDFLEALESDGIVEEILYGQ